MKGCLELDEEQFCIRMVKVITFFFIPSKVKKCKSKISQQLLIDSGLFYKIIVCTGVFINMYICAVNKAMGKP